MFGRNTHPGHNSPLPYDRVRSDSSPFFFAASSTALRNQGQSHRHGRDPRRLYSNPTSAPRIRLIDIDHNGVYSNLPARESSANIYDHNHRLGVPVAQNGSRDHAAQNTATAASAPTPMERWFHETRREAPYLMAHPVRFPAADRTVGDDTNTQWEEVSQAAATQGSLNTPGTWDGGWVGYKPGAGFEH